MEAVICPYCEGINHTSAPETMAECAYCGLRFAEARSPYQRLVILDNQLPDAWSRAEGLTARWQEEGRFDREAIVDRRMVQDYYRGPERRRFAGAGPALAVAGK